MAVRPPADGVLPGGVRRMAGRRGVDDDGRPMLVPATTNLLFVCRDNAALSILAEAALNARGHGAYRAYSAGVMPADAVDPAAVAALRLGGLPADGLAPKACQRFLTGGSPPIQAVILLGDEDWATIPRQWPEVPIVVRWPLDDPGMHDDDQAVRTQALRRLRRDLEHRVGQLLTLPPEIAADPSVAKRALRAIGRSARVAWAAEDLLVEVAPVTPDAPCEAVHRLFLDDRALTAVPVVDGDGRVAGLVNRIALGALFAQPVMVDLFGPKPIARLADPSPLTVDCATPVEALAARVEDEGCGAVACGFVITRDGRYAGLGDGAALLRVSGAIAAERIRGLTRSERRFRDIADVTGDWFWEVDSQLRFCYLSDRFADATGIDTASVLGISVGQLEAMGFSGDTLAAVGAAMARREAFRAVVHRVVFPDGRVRYWQTSGKPAFDDDGRFLGYRGTGADVTAAREGEKTLYAAKEAAEQANRMKSEFLANMSHELRTPLNAIIGFSDIIRSEMLGPIGNEYYLEYIRDIHESGRVLLDLINGVLDLAQIEAGRLELEEAPFDLSVALGDCAVAIADAAKRAELSVITRPIPAVRLRGDELRFRQVLLHLLDNAVKFTSAGGEIVLSAEIEPAGDLSVTIADTGIGMQEEDLARAQEPFWQAEAGMTRRRDGVGLGLPLARRLINLHGGSLDLRSTPDEGTIATVRLPGWRVQMVLDGPPDALPPRQAAGGQA